MGKPKSKLNVVGGTDNVGDEELRQWLENYIEAHPHHPTKVLQRADHIGASRTALDAFLKGTYFLPKPAGMGVDPTNSQTERLIRAYRDKTEGAYWGGIKNSFIETRLWQQFQYLCNTTIKEKAITIGYGKPGVGKSRALRQYRTEKQTTMPIEILCSANITPKYFAEKIGTELNLNTRLSLPKLEDAIADKLQKTERLIFVDQANYLNERGLGTICYIWERVHIPIVLLGTKDLFDLFSTSSLTEDVRTQLSSRIAWHCEFLGLHLDEVKSILVEMLGEFATTAVVKQIFTLTGGKLDANGQTNVGSNHRQLEMLIPRVLAITEKRKDELHRNEITMENLIHHSWRKLITS